MVKVDNELILIYTAFKEYFKENKIEHKEIFYKYKIEMMTWDLEILISVGYGIHNDYCCIVIKNDKTNKTTRYTIDYKDEQDFKDFNNILIYNLIKKVEV